MLFNSLSFAVFLPIVFILYWAVPHKWRWIILFVSSYYFYMSWNIKYVLLILFTTFTSYICAIGLERAKCSFRGGTGGKFFTFSHNGRWNLVSHTEFQWPICHALKTNFLRS